MEDSTYRINIGQAAAFGNKYARNGKILCMHCTCLDRLCKKHAEICSSVTNTVLKGKVNSKMCYAWL